MSVREERGERIEERLATRVINAFMTREKGFD